ncbi:MAG: chemotaxis response regulator protein-glutamate methylesterase [Clostridia bacterium]|nr:chemotaxis response regulator protein-glutamate methylesterase [Clostridia bacterium]
MIKVLIVDDSAFMRMIVRDMLVGEKDISIVGIARNGQEALDKIKALKPDVVTMDVTMPVMDGIEATQKIMEQHPVPIIMVSALTKQGTDSTLMALEAGAIDYIEKENLRRENLLRKIRCAAQANLNGKKVSTVATSVETDDATYNRSFKLAAIGISTGGPSALVSIIPKIRGDIKGSIMIAQHMPPIFTNSLAQRLDGMSALKVVEAQDGMSIEPGTVYIGPGGQQMAVSQGNRISIVSNESLGYRYAPSVNLLMESVGDVYGKHAVCIIMTGMGSDGRNGISAAKKNSSHIIAQSPDSCVVYGMPRAVIESNLQDEIVHLDDMAKRINQLIK